MNKKGVIQNIPPLVIGLVSVGIVLAVGFLILANVLSNSQVAADANATSGVQETRAALADIPEWLPIIVIVAIGVLVLAMVSMFRSR